MTKGIKEERVYFDLTVPEGESIILGRHAVVEELEAGRPLPTGNRESGPKL